MMSSKSLIHWSGMAAVIGAFLMLVTSVVPEMFFPHDEALSVSAMSSSWSEHRQTATSPEATVGQLNQIT